MIDLGRTRHLWRDDMDESGIDVEDEKEWRIAGRGEDGIAYDMIGGGGHNNTIPLWTPHPY
jgi:hypothetical protein